ncbi:hypothetical protein D3C80_957990 [compost metagenome]
MLVFQGKGVIGDAVLLQQDTEDFVRLLRLEDAGVLAKGEPPQGRFNFKGVAGTAKAAVPLSKIAHYPAHPALQLAVVPHQELAGLVQHGAEIHVGLGACQLEAQVKWLVEPLFQGKLRHHEGALGQGPHLDGKL